MLKSYSPPFVTETDQPAPWLDCSWASALMLANMATLGKYPTTRNERQELRNASGDHFGGSNLHDVAIGIQVRYGWTLTLDSPSWTELLQRLARGDGAEVQGLYSRLTPHFQRWDPAFAQRGTDSGHAVYVQGHDRGGNYHLDHAGVPTDVFWNDPLGRSPAGTPATQRYRGEWMPIAVLHAFIRGFDTSDNALSYVATVRQGEHA